MFKDRSAINQFMSGARNPPNYYVANAYYGNLDTFAQTSGAISPTGPDAQAGKVQADLSHELQPRHPAVQFAGAVIDASATSAAFRDTLPAAPMDANAIPMYARFAPANQDPTQPGKPLADNFLRPYSGYGP